MIIKKFLDLSIFTEFGDKSYESWINQNPYITNVTHEISNNIKSISDSSIVLILNKFNEIEIIKNIDYHNNDITPLQSLNLISKLLTKVILDKNKTIQVFEPTIQNEIFDECFEILKKWNIQIGGSIKESKFNEV